MIVIFLGPPGSGKGTQSEFVSKELKLPHLSTGDMLRGEISANTDLGKKIEAVVSSGALVSEDVINNLVEKKLVSAECVSGCVLDGYPRTLSQAQFLNRLIHSGGWKSAVLYFNVSDNIVVERIVGRYCCKNCGAIYHEKFFPTKKNGICDRCHESELIYRSDDKLETVSNRLLNYHTQTEGLLRFFKEQGNLFTIDASKEVDEVKYQVLETLKRC